MRLTGDLRAVTEPLPFLRVCSPTQLYPSIQGIPTAHAEAEYRRVSFAVCPLVSRDRTDARRRPPDGRFGPRRRSHCLVDRAHHEHRRERTDKPRPLSRLLQRIRLTVPKQHLLCGRELDLDPATGSNGRLPAHGSDDWLDLQRLGHRRGYGRERERVFGRRQRHRARRFRHYSYHQDGSVITAGRIRQYSDRARRNRHYSQKLLSSRSG